MKSRTWFPAILAALVLLVSACTGPDDDAASESTESAAGGIPCPEPSVMPAGGGDPITAVTLPCLGGDGEAMPLSDGAPMVINIWASWCAPCRDELPSVEAYAAKGKVAVLGVNTQDTEDAARSIVEDFGLTFPSRFDPDGTLLATLGKRVLPVTVLVTAEGTVAHTYSGPALSEDALAALVEKHLDVA
ncbi:TlpA disulfide reductase family protein [Phytomonospora sp. NPDC050363]|uniref:TlpA family protein disulfide reductase n=1 Tax=Phytomonospora sp. NPDC050363 TaxID=3155642 RepID=UPI0033D9A080